MPHAPARRALTVLAAACALVAPPAFAVYKWVDEKGVTHFSDEPPPDGRKADKVEVKPTPPSSDAKPRDWKALEQEKRKARIEQEQKDEYQKAKSHNEGAERANRCAKAQRELAVLARQRPVYHVNDKGEKVYLEDKDRDAESAKWRREAEAHCGSR